MQPNSQHELYDYEGVVSALRAIGLQDKEIIYAYLVPVSDVRFRLVNISDLDYMSLQPSDVGNALVTDCDKPLDCKVRLFAPTEAQKSSKWAIKFEGIKN